MTRQTPGSLKIDHDIFAPFAKYCRQEGFNISQKATKIIDEFNKKHNLTHNENE